VPIVDPLFWALKLISDQREASTSKYWHAFFERRNRGNEMFRSTIMRFKFPAREGMPEVDVTWWTGIDAGATRRARAGPAHGRREWRDPADRDAAPS
jgi:hypothetical protein